MMPLIVSNYNIIILLNISRFLNRIFMYKKIYYVMDYFSNHTEINHKCIDEHFI